MSSICRRPSQKGAARLVVLVMAALVLCVPAGASATHGTRTLDIEAETGSGTAPAANDVVVKLQGSAATADVVIDAEITGPNDPDLTPGYSPESPDKTCTIAAASDSCSLAFAPSQPAVNQPSVVDTFKVWVDEDNNDTTTEADPAEAADETRFPGGTAEPDSTDVVIRATNPQVTATPPKTLDCKNASTEAFPATDTSLKSNNGAGSKETYTCNVKYQGVNQVNQTVDIENMGGPNDVAEGTDLLARDYTCGPTDATGNCMVTIPDAELTNGQVGTAFLCFWVDDNANDLYNETIVADGGACPERWDTAESGSGTDIPQTDVLKITWEVPVPSVLDITSEDLAKNPTTETADFPMSLKDQFGTSLGGGNVDFKVLTGPNRTGSATADKECTTAADGTCTISHVPNAFQFNGTDKVCAWLDADGDNAFEPTGGVEDGGGCATEPASAGTDNGGLTDRGQVIWSGGNRAPTRLEMDPETQSATASTTRTATVTVLDETLVTPLAGAHVDFEITGVGDSDASDTPNTQDASCTTGADGKCPINILGNAVGTTQIRAWVDIDNDHNAIADGEVDATEGLDEATAPGVVEEPDTTDVVVISWKASPTSVTMGYSAPTILHGTQITLAGFLKAAGAPLAGKTVVVERRVGGDTLFRTLALSVTDANGKWTWTGRPGSTAQYRASFLGESPGLLQSKSGIIKVAVRVIFSGLAASTRTPAPGTAVAFTGKVLPVHSGRRVYLQVLGPNNSWRNVATTICDGTGFFRMTYRRNVGGTLNFRILFPAQDADHGGNISSRFSIRWG
jgi:hypothetical protein